MSLDLKKKINPLKDSMFVPGRLYSITINPEDTHQYYRSDKNRIEQSIRYYKKKFQQYNWEYVLVPEISTPNNSKSLPRVHFHGIIAFRNIQQVMQWYNCIAVELSRICYYDIDILNQYDKWNEYMYKNDYIMKELLNSIDPTIGYVITSLKINKIIKHANKILKETINKDSTNESIGA